VCVATSAVRVCVQNAARPLSPFPARRSSDLCPNSWAVSMARELAAETQASSGIPAMQAFCVISKLAREETSRMQKACMAGIPLRSEEHTSELQSRFDIVCRLLLEKKK